MSRGKRGPTLPRRDVPPTRRPPPARHFAGRPASPPPPLLLPCPVAPQNMHAMQGMVVMGPMGPMMAGPMPHGMMAPGAMAAPQLTQMLVDAARGGRSSNVFFKTRICNKWRAGACPYGDRCAAEPPPLLLLPSCCCCCCLRERLLLSVGSAVLHRCWLPMRGESVSARDERAARRGRRQGR